MFPATRRPRSPFCTSRCMRKGLRRNRSSTCTARTASPYRACGTSPACRPSPRTTPCVFASLRSFRTTGRVIARSPKRCARRRRSITPSCSPTTARWSPANRSRMRSTTPRSSRRPRSSTCSSRAGVPVFWTRRSSPTWKNIFRARRTYVRHRGRLQDQARASGGVHAAHARKRAGVARDGARMPRVRRLCGSEEGDQRLPLRGLRRSRRFRRASGKRALQALRRCRCIHGGGEECADAATSEWIAMNAPAPDWSLLRAEFPTLSRWTYLDVARKTPAPRCQERALIEYMRDIYEEAGAGAWAAPQVAETRAALARLLGAKPAQIAFTKNTTEGLNIAAHAFDLHAGDNIVLTDLEHPANVWVWKHWEAKGVEIRYARSREGRLPLDA